VVLHPLLRKRGRSHLTPINTTRRILLRYQGDFDSDVYLEIKRHKIFDLTQERNHTMDRSDTNFHLVYASYKSH
jgi:hypothetical protein